MTTSKNQQGLYKETRWHLLRVAKNGGVRPLTHFRRWVITIIGLMLFLLICIAGLLYAWWHTDQERMAAKEKVSRQLAMIESIQREKEAAQARLAITQSKLKAALANVSAQVQSEPEKSAEKPATDKKKASESTPPSKKTAAQTAEKPVAKPAAPPSSSNPDEVLVIEKVTADNLFVCANPDDTTVSIEFKVINMGTRQQPVSGHAFIVLKDSHDEQDQWLVLPKAMLMDGRPVQARGTRFRIYNYRTIKFKVGHENPGVFAHATIFIFKESGELIFERDFALEPVKICH